MLEICFDIEWRISPQGAENITSTIPFVDSSIVRARIDLTTNQVFVELRPPFDEKAVREKLDSFFLKHRPIRQSDLSKVAYDRSGQTKPYCEDVFNQLIERGDLYEHTPGIFSLSGAFLQLYQALDSRIREFASEQHAKEVILPITTSLKTLNQADFFKRTPQFAQFMCTLKPGLDSILDFSSKVTVKDCDLNVVNYLENPENMCRSAICLSSYPQFAGKQLAPADYVSWTTFGKAFRNEASNVNSLERLYEFSMREIIYFGDREFVAKRLNECMQWFIEKMEEWDLNGMIQTANDPFFAERIQALQFYQLAEQSKYEIRWLNPWSQSTVSVGSINNHGSHFSKAYQIRLADGNFATTGCVGFGYERLLFLLLSQHGIDEARWPQSMKAFFAI